jgi:hypothetical protein
MGTGRQDAIDRVWSAPLSGQRDIAASLARATQLKERSQANSIKRGVLLIASQTDDTISRSLSEDPPDDVHVVTYGSQIEEATLAFLVERRGGVYGHADQPQDLIQRVADVRRVIEEASLVSTGVLKTDAAGDASVPVGIGSGQIFVRFTLFGVSSHVISITNADGHRFTDDQGTDDVRLSAIGDRVSVGVGAASAGTWQLTLHGAPPDRSIPYEVETFFSRDPEARAEADLDATEGLRIGYMGGGLPTPTKVTASLLASDGSVQTVELRDTPGEDALVCCIGTMLEGHIRGPIRGGSYVITVRSVGGEGATSYERAVRFGFYMWPAVDTDGDGIRDQVELRNGLNPDDPADGATDADSDGLSMSRELGDLATDPFDYDTDDGGEGDGAEVNAGRDPLDPSDDHVAKACLADASALDSDQFRPQSNAPRAPKLEALLPDTLLGEQMTKTSILGTPLLHPSWPGLIWYALVKCTGGFEPTLQVAYESATAWGGLGVVAIRIERSAGGKLVPVPAQEIADAFIHRLMPGSEDDLRPYPVEIDGRSATLTETGWLLYPHDDVLFMVMNLAFGDCFQDCGTPPKVEDLAADLLPKLPGPGG